MATIPTDSSSALQVIRKLPIALERDVFLRTLIRELAGTLQEVVGLEEASGFVSVVGQKIGDQINESYQAALDVSQLDRAQVAAVLVDLKRRIQGDFYVIEENDEKIVFGNRACPFAEKVIGLPAMCMMTSNVFGVIAAENHVSEGDGNGSEFTVRLPALDAPAVRKPVLENRRRTPRVATPACSSSTTTPTTPRGLSGS
ncbi:MAG: methanogen output domain 1-containing protein [Paludisphaera borealis]|uniref:methanogen output domain 1-containing protein n=1 Tax=Paludisphaera borealis TaxID=1387353 RepID=UPI00284E59CE|nr:methanogen output domain 1-containing protein [Paludisphaera borealis]MDR3621154.1 methanogen output domain 1-containing protein [Paludisphaera borealis]